MIDNENLPDEHQDRVEMSLCILQLISLQPYVVSVEIIF